jgi:flagellar hook-basal body complex protein FliE
MIVAPISSAQQIAQAYRPAAVSGAGNASFSSMIGQAAETALQTMHQAESITANGIAGQADTQAVVQALSNAELTMQTVVTVRDKILGAYNDIMHMSI